MSERQKMKNEINKELDKTGLSGFSAGVFDVFAQTAQRGYLFLCNMDTNVSRWSKCAVEDFDLPFQAGGKGGLLILDFILGNHYNRMDRCA